MADTNVGELSPDSVLDILDEPDTPESPEPTPPKAGGKPEEVVEPALEPKEPKTEEQTAEPAAKPEKSGEVEGEKPEGDFDEEVGPPRVVEQDGKKEWHWSESRARTIYSGYEEAKKYREVAPTVEEAGKHRDAFIDQRVMHSHFRSGDPAKLDHFINYWNRQSPQGMAAMTGRMVEFARATKSPVYSEVAKVTVRDVADEFYREYAAIPSKETSEDAQKLLFAAQMLEWFLGGEFRPPEAIKAPDPVAERLAAVERREREVQQFHSERAQAAWTNFSNGLNSEIRTGVSEEINEALKPIEHLKKGEKDQQLLYKAAAGELREAVKKAIASDKPWRTLYSLRHEEAQQNMSDKDRKDLTALYKDRARRAISSAKAAVLSSVGASVIKQSEQEHQRLTESGRRKETRGSAPSPARLPSSTEGKTLSEKVNSILGL